MTLRDLLAEAAADLDPAEPVSAGDDIEWRRNGQAFAAVGPTRAEFLLPAVIDRAEFLLPAVIGRAALGTPDTSRSERGAGWVAFEPPELDRMAVDRAIAWFEAAWRHAAD